MKHYKLIVLGVFLSSFVLADDTEIYGTVEVDDDQRINSNVLFIMDTSGSMSGNVETSHVAYDPAGDYSNGNYYEDQFYTSTSKNYNQGYNISILSTASSDGCTDVINSLNNNGTAQTRLRSSGSKYRCNSGWTYFLHSGHYMNWYHFYAEITNATRMKTVVDVVKDLTYSLNNINLGLMRFDDNSNGGIIDIPIQDVDVSGPLIRSKLDSYTPNGGTPLEESMYEAYRYYFGEDWYFGKDASPNSSDSGSLIGGSGDTYKTPIEAVCQKNHIILLTDGEPTSDSSANTKIKNLIANISLPDGITFPDAQETDCSGNGDCMDELAYWMENNKHTNTDGVSTYTIGGFGLTDGVDKLKRTATAGGGAYYAADKTSDLIIALENIFLKISETDATFTAPAVSVNAFNTSEHRDELFYALFRPDKFIQWSGNLKKFKIGSTGLVTDKYSDPAIDQDTGFFAKGTVDYFSSTANNDGFGADGANVALGGIANLLESSNRTVYTESKPGELSLSLLRSFSSDTNTGFNIPDSDEFTKVRDWVLGIDVNDDDENPDTSNRFSIGDPLHSEPVIVTYGGTEENPDSTIFFGTNEGFIHAIDTETGLEEFAFLPQALHANQNLYYDNTLAASSKPYGMDGPLSTWFYDKNDDNMILNGSTPQTDEHVYLYGGMRRGGQNYYGLDVTDRSAPQVKFIIEGGQGKFEKLGQTWSKMQIAKVRYNNNPKFVLFFSGGYDTNQDGNTTAEPDTIGNAVYIVDAVTGERLWWASNTGANKNISEMTNSIPADVSLVDYNGDGYTDYFFAADTGGRVFRFDINQANSGADSFADGGLVASISDSTVEGNRRFYNKPNISIVKDKQYGDYLTIAIGTGHRAHPKFTTAVENRFYVIKDRYPYKKPDSYESTTSELASKVTLNVGEAVNPLKLYNMTDLMIGGDDELADNDHLRKMLNNGGGWYVTLSGLGEKVLAESLTYEGTIIFTTFKPSSGASSTSCAADIGESRIYALDQTTATPNFDLDGDKEADASVVISIPGIAPKPVIIIPPSSGSSGSSSGGTSNSGSGQKPVVAVGTVILTPESEANNKPVTPIYWRQNDVH